MRATDELMKIRDELVGRCEIPPALDAYVMNALLKAYLMGVHVASVAAMGEGAVQRKVPE
jgi:hypothetical protein